MSKGAKFSEKPLIGFMRNIPTPGLLQINLWKNYAKMKTNHMNKYFLFVLVLIVGVFIIIYGLLCFISYWELKMVLLTKGWKQPEIIKRKNERRYKRRLIEIDKRK